VIVVSMCSAMVPVDVLGAKLDACVGNW